MKRKRQVRVLSNYEENLMRALHLKNVRQLDKLFSAPISEYAASHSAPPDEEYELADRMYATAAAQMLQAQKAQKSPAILRLKNGRQSRN